MASLPVERRTLAPAGVVEMAVLVEGQKFGLSSKSEKSKSVVYVKLTDSSLRSLEEYLKHRVSCCCYWLVGVISLS